MPTKLDEISLAIGGLQSEVRTIADAMKADRVSASDDRREIRSKLYDMDRRLKTIEPVAAEVAAMKPHVEDYRSLKARIAAAVAILSGAFFLAWQGLASVGPEVKAFLLRALTKS